MNKLIHCLFLFTLLFFANFCFASWDITQTWNCIGGCGGEDGNSGGGIEYHTCTTVCSCGEDGECDTTCSDPVRVSTASPWQVCAGGSQVHSRGRTCGPDAESYNLWTGKGKFYYVCSGSCLDAVSGIRYYNNPYYPQKPELTISGSENYPETCSEEDLEKYPLGSNCIEPSENAANVDLPLKIDWDEDEYWLNNNGNVAKQFASGLIKSSSLEEMWKGGPQSYIFTLNITKDSSGNPKWITNPDAVLVDGKNMNDYLAKSIKQDKQEIKQGYFQTILSLNNQASYIPGGKYRSSEYNLKVDHNACWLASGNQSEGYTIKIQTCCNINGTNCNSGATANFKTSTAPELKSPEDLDWNGPGYSAWDAWSSFKQNEDMEDYLTIEGYIDLPYDQYAPFDYKTKSIANSGGKIEFPIFLDWCDMPEVNEREEKGSWLIQTFQFLKVDGENVVINDETDNLVITKNGVQYVEYPNLKSPSFYLSAKPAYGGVDFTDVLYSTYYDEKSVAFFSKNTIYSWQLSGKETLAVTYGDVTEHWSFETGDTDIENKFRLLSDGQTLGIPTVVQWEKAGQINSFIFNGPQGEVKTTSTSVTIENLALNTEYSFSVTPCSDFFSAACETENKISGTFKTTGAPPEAITIDAEEKDGSYFLPIEADWSSVDGAESYVYSLNGVEAKTSETKVFLFSPILKSNTDYSLKVKSCADEDGNLCGMYGNPYSFKTATLSVPENIEAGENNVLYTNRKNISWDAVEGANYYYYSVKYNGGNDSKTCTDYAEEEKHVSMLNTTYTTLAGNCEGSYTVELKGCMDYEATDCGGTKTLSLRLERNVDETGENSGGLIPCGREYDDPDTSWDETQACSVSHVFLLIKIILDFILWRLVPALLIVMLLYTAGVYIFHKFIDIDSTTLLEKTKEIWKAVGIGCVIVFLAWTIINVILLFLEANMSFFNF